MTISIDAERAFVKCFIYDKISQQISRKKFPQPEQEHLQMPTNSTILNCTRLDEKTWEKIFLNLG